VFGVSVLYVNPSRSVTVVAYIDMGSCQSYLGGIWQGLVAGLLACVFSVGDRLPSIK